MKRFTGTSYDSAIKLAGFEFKDGFEIISKREINLSKTGLSKESLFEITVIPREAQSKTIKKYDNNLTNPNYFKLIKNELKDIKELKTEILLLRQEVNLLSKRINNLINPDINMVEVPNYNALIETGFEKPLALKFIREMSLLNIKPKKRNDLISPFNNRFKNLFIKLSINDGDNILIFGQPRSGKSELVKLIAKKISENHQIKIINELQKIEPHKGITIIDAPEFRPNQEGMLKNLKKSSDSINETHRILVISSITGLEEMLHIVASFSPIKPNGIIFTRFDETILPGKLISVLNEANIKIYGLTNYKNKKVKFIENCEKLFINCIAKNFGLVS